MDYHAHSYIVYYFNFYYKTLFLLLHTYYITYAYIFVDCLLFEGQLSGDFICSPIMGGGHKSFPRATDAIYVLMSTQW